MFFRYWSGGLVSFPSSAVRRVADMALLTAGFVLSLMIVPLITATLRDELVNLPGMSPDGAMALGATRFEALRTVLLPACEAGVFRCNDLTACRALGETMAVLMVSGNALNYLPGNIYTCRFPLWLYFIAAGLPAERVFTLYHSWELKNAEASFPEGDYYLFLGRLMEAKGVKQLAGAWDILARQGGAQAPRLIIAGDGPLADWVKAAQARNPRIEYRGYVKGEEKDRLIAGCRAVVQPSICAEALSLVIYEAYDYGKPVLVAASGGMPELVSAETGLIHTPGVAEELAAQVRQMEGLPKQERQKMGQVGRRWLLANTDRARWKKEFYAIVERTLS